MYRTDFWTLWEKARVGCFERTALKLIYYQGWNRSPARVGCMIRVLRAGALGRPRRVGWGGRREGGSGWGTRVNPWLIHVIVWQKTLQYCKVISLQLIKINGKKNKSLLYNIECVHSVSCPTLYNSLDCSPSGSSVHGIFQARIWEWVSTPFSRGSSWLRDGTSFLLCLLQWQLASLPQPYLGSPITKSL